jgi:hypothetical protein
MEVYYYLYQITNLINGKIYVGVHKTSNFEDGYMGSGIGIRRAISKYGINNFQKCILQFFSSEDDMYKGEAQVVTTSFLQQEHVYNISEGGKPVGITIRRQNGKYTGNLTKERGTGIFSEDSKEKRLQWVRSAEGKNKSRQNQPKAVIASQTTEAKLKRKETMKKLGHQKGERNSQYGTCWIHRGQDVQKIKKDQLGVFLEQGWSRGTKDK